MRTALACREDGLIDALLKILCVLQVLTEEDQTCTRTTEGFVRRGRDDIAVIERIVQDLRRDKAGGVCNVGQEERAVLIRCLPEGRIVPITRVCGGTADNETRLEDSCLLSEPIVIDELRCWVQTIREGLEVNRGRSDLLLGRLLNTEVHRSVSQLTGIDADVCVRNNHG